QPVHVHVDEAQAGGSAPVPEEARLDVLRAQRLPEQRVVPQIDLPDRQVVRRAPVRVDPLELALGERSRHAGLLSLASILPARSALAIGARAVEGPKTRSRAFRCRAALPS